VATGCATLAKTYFAARYRFTLIELMIVIAITVAGGRGETGGL
jgi:hypothetical protein